MADWTKQILNPFAITTGDGKRYVVKSMMSSFTLVTEYQTSEFTFIGVSGSLVKRNLPIGKKYNLEIFFDGANHVEDAAAFEISCRDSRPLLIEHPFYDLINVQITSLNWDQSQGNTTRVYGTVIETIIEGAPNVVINPLDQIPIKFDTAISDLEVSLTEIVLPADINTLNNDNVAVYAKGVPITSPLGGEFETYTNAFNTASSYITTATADPIQMMRSVMHVITLPSEFNIDVRTRIGVLVDTFNQLRQNLFGLLAVSSKQLFQNKQGATIAAMCNAAGTPLSTDFKNAGDVIQVIEELISARRRFIQDLDNLSNINASSPNSFIPNFDALQSLGELINTTISALYNLSLSARSERSLVCEKDTNWIILAHRLYGLDANDQNITDLIAQNQDPQIVENFYDELIQIRKGRKIVYYL